MLLTVQEEAKRQEIIMVSPERLQKVKKSMGMIKVVLNERVCALNEFMVYIDCSMYFSYHIHPCIFILNYLCF